MSLCLFVSAVEMELDVKLAVLSQVGSWHLPCHMATSGLYASILSPIQNLLYGSIAMASDWGKLPLIPSCMR